MRKLKLRSKIFLSFLVIFAGYYLYSYHSENKKYEILEILSDMDYSLDNVCIHKAYVDYNKEQFDEFRILDKPSVYLQYYIQYLFGSFSNFRDWEVNKVKADKIEFTDKENKKQFSSILTKCDFEWADETGEGIIKEDRIVTPSNVSISLPILSADGETAIIQLTENCGVLCGFSSNYLFKKDKGKWKLIKQGLSWIS